METFDIITFCIFLIGFVILIVIIATSSIDDGKKQMLDKLLKEKDITKEVYIKWQKKLKIKEVPIEILEE